MKPKIVVLVAVLFCVLASKGQPNNNEDHKTLIYLSENDFLGYNLYQKKSIISFVEKSVRLGQLTPYKTSSLKNKLSIKEYKLAGATIHKCDTQEFFAYKLISPPTDTVYLNPRKYLGFRITYTSNLFVLKFDSLKRVYFKLDEVKEILGRSHKNFIELFEFKSPKKGGSVPNSIIFNDRTLAIRGVDLCKQIAKHVYIMGTSGTAKAYKDISLTDTFALAETKQRGNRYETLQLPEQHSPEEVFDTTIYRLFDPKSISSINAYHLWKTDGEGNITEELLALSPTSDELRFTEQFHKTGLFLIKASDIKKYLGQKRYSYLKNVAISSILKRGTEEVEK